MKSIEENLMEIKNNLEENIKISESKLDKNNKDKIWVSKINGKSRFYHLSNGEKRYLSDNEEDKKKYLIQQEYYRKLNLHSRALMKKVNSILKYCDKKKLFNFQRNFHPEKEKYIEPINKSWVDLVEEWYKIPFIPSSYKSENLIIPTKSGVQVRRRIEKIIADYLYDNNIKFKYECPIFLKKSKNTLYPDFTVLNPATGKVLLIEYFGLMDNEEYRNDAYKKIKIYEDEGYLHGVDFIYFFESESHPLNLKNIFVYLNLYIINPAKDLIN
ncbi:hypothetical protein [Helcococcus massiliensis]|uniref:hypothetical protein n=1 Tax=Helcococcus massiliensis TaxID=2040290 RepID=UPI000CDEE488|nr:hypothetical protein [Helcococcus massiliensis]